MTFNYLAIVAQPLISAFIITCSNSTFLHSWDILLSIIIIICYSLFYYSYIMS